MDSAVFWTAVSTAFITFTDAFLWLMGNGWFWFALVFGYGMLVFAGGWEAAKDWDRERNGEKFR